MGTKSRVEASACETAPAGIRPGQRAIPATRCPPSHVLHLPVFPPPPTVRSQVPAGIVRGVSKLMSTVVPVLLDVVAVVDVRWLRLLLLYVEELKSQNDRGR